MRIATWNLGHGAKKNTSLVASQIRKIEEYSPDIIVLTETCDEVDLSSLDKRYKREPTEKHEDGNYYAVIWTRFDVSRIYETTDPEMTICAQLETDLGSLLVYGTIITYHGDKGPNEDSPAWAEHYKAIGVQGGDWERLSRETGLPLIVAGDFNQTRDDSKQTYGTKHGRALLTGQLQRCDMSCLTTENFGVSGKLTPAPGKEWPRNNIDHICVTNNRFKRVEVGVWDHFTNQGKLLSDHNGVFVDLS